MKEKFDAMSALPFSTNPFFAKTVADSGEFNGNGTEGMKPAFGGYSCQWIGNLNCSEDFTFQCEGGGVVDCTGTCPGDEETLSSMMAMIQDPVLAEKYPLVAEMQNRSAQNSGNNEKFLGMLRGCGFEKILALVNIGKDGFGNQEESDITHVDESAVQGFGGDYDYDYYEDYEDEEVIEVENKDQESREGDEDKSKQEEIYLTDRKVISLF